MNRLDRIIRRRAAAWAAWRWWASNPHSKRRRGVDLFFWVLTWDAAYHAEADRLTRQKIKRREGTPAFNSGSHEAIQGDPKNG